MTVSASDQSHAAVPNQSTEFDEGELGRDQDKGKAEVAGMVSILGGRGELTSPIVRPRPAARHFSSFLADASSKFSDCVPTLAANEVKQGPVLKSNTAPSKKESPLQSLFRSIWERVQKVCIYSAIA